MTKAIKIVFYAINGEGLGHIFRSLNIAKALRKLIDCNILFLTNTHFTEVFEKEGFDYVKGGVSSKELSNKTISRQEYLELNTKFVLDESKKFKPDIFFFDQAILPEAANYMKSRNILLVYVLREIKNLDYFLNFKNTLPLFDLILVPHEKEEINFEVIARLDTDVDVDYFINGGILQYVLRKVLAENQTF